MSHSETEKGKSGPDGSKNQKQGQTIKMTHTLSGPSLAWETVFHFQANRIIIIIINIFVVSKKKKVFYFSKQLISYKVAVSVFFIFFSMVPKHYYNNISCVAKIFE